MSKATQVGLKDVHTGKFMGEGVAYADVLAIEGALDAKITVTESSEPFSCDDGTEIDVIVEKIDIEIGMAGFTLKERAFILGENLVNGSIASNVNDVANRPYVGMAFKSLKRGGAIRYYSIPKIKFSLETDEFATKAGKAEGKTMKLVGTAVALTTGVFRVISDSDEEGVNSEWLNTFVETIPQTTAPAPTPASKVKIKNK